MLVGAKLFRVLEVSMLPSTYDYILLRNSFLCCYSVSLAVYFQHPVNRLIIRDVDSKMLHMRAFYSRIPHIKLYPRNCVYFIVRFN